MKFQNKKVEIFELFVILLYHLIMSRRKKIYKEPLFVKIVRVILIFVLLPFVALHLILSAVKNAKEKKANKEKIAVFGMSQIDALSGVEFEGFLKKLFEKMGYFVETTKKSYDFGADLVISKNGTKSIVQAKCLNKTVGAKAIQEIIGAKNHYNVQNLMVVTNRYFSKEAETMALENDVKLINRDSLQDLMKRFEVYIDKEKNEFCAITKNAVQEMERKYPFWI